MESKHTQHLELCQLKHFRVVLLKSAWEQGVLVHWMWSYSTYSKNCIATHTENEHTHVYMYICVWVWPHLGPCPWWARSQTYAKCCDASSHTQILAGTLRVCVREWLLHMHVAVLASFPGAGPRGKSPLQAERVFTCAHPPVRGKEGSGR